MASWFDGSIVHETLHGITKHFTKINVRFQQAGFVNNNLSFGAAGVSASGVAASAYQQELIWNLSKRTVQEPRIQRIQNSIQCIYVHIFVLSPTHTHNSPSWWWLLETRVGEFNNPHLVISRQWLNLPRSCALHRASWKMLLRSWNIICLETCSCENCNWSLDEDFRAIDHCSDLVNSYLTLVNFLCGLALNITPLQVLQPTEFTTAT